MRRYLFSVIIISTGIFLAGVTCVWVINPYGLWIVPDVLTVVDAETPRPLPNQRLAKAWHIRNREPDGLIIGSSRSEFGLDPDHPGWTAANVYNASLAGATIHELHRYLLHAYAVEEIAQLVVSLDLSMFAEEIPLSAPTFSDEYLVVDRNNHPNDDWRRLSRWQPLISVDGWRDAVRVVGSTDTIVRDERFFLLDGQREPTYYWYKEIQSRGHRSAFERSTIKLADEFEAQFASGGMCPDKLSQYRKILEFAYEHGIEMHIILSPVHVWLLEVYYREGAWSILEAWKRALVRENARVAAQVGAPPAPLWDFSEYNEFTTEEIPPAGDTQTRMRWYWEVSHYRAELGEVVLDRVFGVDTVSVAGKEGFGVRITPETMDEHLENVREQRERYAAAAQEELLFLDRHISRD